MNEDIVSELNACGASNLCIDSIKQAFADARNENAKLVAANNDLHEQLSTSNQRLADALSICETLKARLQKYGLKDSAPQEFSSYYRLAMAADIHRDAAIRNEKGYAAFAFDTETGTWKPKTEQDRIAAWNL